MLCFKLCVHATCIPVAVCMQTQHYCVIRRISNSEAKILEYKRASIQVCKMSTNVVVRRLGLSVGRQLLLGGRGRSLVGAVSTGFPQALEVRWFSSDSQPNYSKEYFDGVRELFCLF